MKFFHTLREKTFVLRELKRGNFLPLLKYVLFRLRLSSLFSVKRKHYSIHISYTPLAFWLWTRQDKAKNDELFYETFLTRGNVVLDCGAHVGTLAMTAASLVGNEGKVIACEMHPRTYSYLARNIKQNGFTNITAINTAIGEREQTVLVTDEYVSDINHVSDEGSLAIPMTTIDDVAHDLPRIDLLKLDVEGYEFQALKGATETLPKIKAVYFEAAPRNFARYGYALKDILGFLEERGYDCFAFDEENKMQRINTSYSPSVKYENILALRTTA